MYTPTATVPGEVWIDGVLAKATLAAYVNEFGFWLANQAGSWGGPHFEINLRPNALADMLRHAQAGRAAITMQGKGIGHVDEVRGRPVADDGPCRRRLARVDVYVRRDAGSTRFSFEGSTRALDPSTCRGIETSSAARRAFWRFRLWFLVDDDKLPLHFVDHTALQAMQVFTRSSGQASPMHEVPGNS